MSNRLIFALVLIGLTVVVLLFNTSGSIGLNLIITSGAWSKPLVLLGFVVVGVVVGLFIR